MKEQLLQKKRKTTWSKHFRRLGDWRHLTTLAFIHTITQLTSKDVLCRTWIQRQMMSRSLFHHVGEAVFGTLPTCCWLQHHFHILLCSFLHVTAPMPPKLFCVGADKVTVSTVEWKVAPAVKLHEIMASKQERATTVGTGYWWHLVNLPQVALELFAILWAKMTALLRADLDTLGLVVIFKVLLQLRKQHKFHLANGTWKGLSRFLLTCFQQILFWCLVDCWFLSSYRQFLVSKA